MTYSSHLFYLFCLRFGLSRWPNIRMRLRQSFAIFLTYFVCFFLTDMLCFFLTHIVLFFSMAFVLSFFVWVSPCLSDLTSGWDWGKVLPFSEHIPLFSAAPMDHKNIGTRMAPTTFCGYNLHPATWDSFLFEIAELTWQNKSLFFDLCSYLRRPQAWPRVAKPFRAVLCAACAREQFHFRCHAPITIPQYVLWTHTTTTQ